MRLRVIGVGSPGGDDAVGLAVAEHLAREALPADVEVVSRSRPGLALLDDLCAADGVVLVDAVCGAEPPGAVLCVDPERLAASRGASHSLGVGDALALAAALGARTAPLRIIGIAVENGARAHPGAPLSRAVRDAIEPACARVRDELNALRTAAADQLVNASTETTSSRSTRSSSSSASSSRMSSRKSATR